jgi:hypothetical protein
MSEHPNDDLLETFERLRRWVKTGLRRVMEIPRKQPHYAAALLVVIGCEALGRLLYNKKEHVFVKELIGPYPHISEAMASDLFRALRNGLAHTYDTNYVRVGARGPRIEIIVSWTDSHEHLGPRHNPPGIYLALPTMQRDLENIFNRHLAELRMSPRRKVPSSWEAETVTWASPKGIPGWRQFLSKVSEGR